MEHLRGLTANHPATDSARARWIVRTTLSAAALALAVSPFGELAVARADYKEVDFASCLERDMPTDYCCEHAGGVMRNGACIDPETLKVTNVRPSPRSVNVTVASTKPAAGKGVSDFVLGTPFVYIHSYGRWRCSGSMWWSAWCSRCSARCW